MDEYKTFSRFGVPYIVKTQQEEEDIKAIIKVKETKFKILPGEDRIFNTVDNFIDNLGKIMDEVGVNKKSKVNTLWIFVMPVFLAFSAFIVALAVLKFINRVFIEKELFQKEIPIIYRDTVKIINKRYEKRILGLSGIKEEENVV